MIELPYFRYISLLLIISYFIMQACQQQESYIRILTEFLIEHMYVIKEKLY